MIGRSLRLLRSNNLIPNLTKKQCQAPISTRSYSIGRIKCSSIPGDDAQEKNIEDVNKEVEQARKPEEEQREVPRYTLLSWVRYFFVSVLLFYRASHIG